MSTPTTPKKTSGCGEVASPGGKRSLEYDFWATNVASKLPKIVEEDLKDVRICDLSVCHSFQGKLKIRVNAISHNPSVLKFTADDGENDILVNAFSENVEKFRDRFLIEEWYEMSNFSVKVGNPRFRTGSYQDLEIIITSETKIASAETEDKPLPYTFVTIDDVKGMEDNAVVDLFAIVVKDWGRSCSSNGKNRLEISLTDRTMNTIRLTIWGVRDQLVGLPVGTGISLRKVTVCSYMTVKSIQAQWMSRIEIDNDSEEAVKLCNWFQTQLALRQS